MAPRLFCCSVKGRGLAHDPRHEAKTIVYRGSYDFCCCYCFNSIGISVTYPCPCAIVPKAAMRCCVRVCQRGVKFVQLGAVHAFLSLIGAMRGALYYTLKGALYKGSHCIASISGDVSDRCRQVSSHVRHGTHEHGKVIPRCQDGSES